MRATCTGQGSLERCSSRTAVPSTPVVPHCGEGAKPQSPALPRGAAPAAHPGLTRTEPPASMPVLCIRRWAWASSGLSRCSAKASRVGPEGTGSSEGTRYVRPALSPWKSTVHAGTRRAPCSAGAGPGPQSQRGPSRWARVFCGCRRRAPAPAQPAFLCPPGDHPVPGPLTPVQGGPSPTAIAPQMSGICALRLSAWPTERELVGDRSGVAWPEPLDPVHPRAGDLRSSQSLPGRRLPGDPKALDKEGFSVPKQGPHNHRSRANRHAEKDTERHETRKHGRHRGRHAHMCCTQMPGFRCHHPLRPGVLGVARRRLEGCLLTQGGPSSSPADKVLNSRPSGTFARWGTRRPAPRAPKQGWGTWGSPAEPPYLWGTPNSSHVYPKRARGGTSQWGNKRDPKEAREVTALPSSPCPFQAERNQVWGGGFSLQ